MKCNNQLLIFHDKGYSIWHKSFPSVTTFLGWLFCPCHNVNFPSQRRIKTSRIKYYVRSLEPCYWHWFERSQIARYILIVDKFTRRNVATVADPKMYVEQHVGNIVLAVAWLRIDGASVLERYNDDRRCRTINFRKSSK